MLNIRTALVLILLVIIAVPTHAQEPRDPWDLARRLLGFDAPYALPDVTPLYAPGDTAEFWVTKANADQRTKITAELASVSANVYIWVEDGISYQPQPMRDVAAQLGAIWTGLRSFSLYGQPTILPGFNAQVTDPSSLIPIPDVDNDPHLFILYAADLGNDAVLFNLLDSLPTALAPFSNQHEMIYVNTSAVPGAALNEPVFISLLSTGMYELLVNYHTPEQAQWLREAFSLFIATQFELTAPADNALAAFFQMPNTSLVQPARLGTALPTQGVQQLFINYLIQRFNVGLIQNLFTRPGDGLAALDAALAEADFTDPVTRETYTARDIFADFVMTNALSTLSSDNQTFGDGRYLHTIAQLPADQVMAATPIQDDYDVQLTGQAVNQFGTQYFYILNTNPAVFQLTFTGRATTPRLNMPGEADNAYYWSGRGRNQSTTLTRAFDLSGVESATLNFDVWFDLVNQWNYAYVEVSADGGATWAVVRTEASSTRNANGAAYGPGYTGTSNPAGPRPFPLLGIVFDADGMTVTDIVADGPASTTDLQAGDQIVGYEGEVWAGPPNIIGVLADYAPGDTFPLLIERDGERFDVPVVLGAHPTRIVDPAPLWLPQSVDLSAYAGSEILVRFEYVSLPEGENSGIAIDNITIPEIEFADDGTGEGWTLNGWQQVANAVPQDFLVQVASLGTEQRLPSVRALIGVADDTTSGDWTFNAAAREVFIVAVSGLNHDTAQPAQFDLTITEVE